MVMSGVAPPTVDALRRVRRRTSGTHLWTCDAGRAATRIRSEALHRTGGRSAADRAERVRERVPSIATASPQQIVEPSGSNPRLPLPLTVILNSSDADYNARQDMA